MKVVFAGWMQVFPQDGRQMRPDMPWDGLAALCQGVNGSFQVERIPENDGVEDQAQDQRADEPGFVPSISHVALSAEKHGLGKRVERLGFVEVNKNALPQGSVAKIAEQVARSGDAAHFFKGLAQREMSGYQAQLGDDERWSD